jgi:hypothetical protein
MQFKNRNRIIQELEKNHICFVLITCSEDSGQLKAEMDYLGDTILASYLLQKAQIHFDETEIHENDIDASSKICSLEAGK